MDHELSPEEVESLLPAYALDAVDDDERDAIEAHLARSPEADGEVAEFRNAAAMLAFAGGPPPAGVWDRIESQLGPRGSSADAPVVSIDTARAARDERDERTSRAPAWRRLAAVAAVAAVLAGAVVFVAVRDDSASTPTAAALAQQAQHARREAGARTATLVDADGNALATAVVLPDGRGYLESSLPSLPHGRTYQLWSVGGAQTVSLGVLGRDPGVVAFAAAPGTTSLAVSDETAGGVVAPTQAPIAVGDVRA
jgi:anti-sigma-K factor RskA